MRMMTKANIRMELGWSDEMISSLLQAPASTKKTRRNNEYVYELYNRDRVLAVAQSKEGSAAKRRWDETLRSDTPNPGWMTRLGDMGGHSGSQQSRPEGCWSCVDTASPSTSPIKLSRPDAESTGGMVS
jgi:hypothetical protein